MKSSNSFKLNIAVIFHQEVTFGGGYQQSINSALLLKKLPKKYFVINFFTLKKKNIEVLRKYKIKANFLNLSPISKLIIFIKTQPRYILIKNILRLFNINSKFESKLINKKIDIVYFLSPTRIAADLNKLNYIYTLWDICHRDEVEFPEVRDCEIFEFRDALCKNVLPRAQSIIVDSEFSKKNISERYSIQKSRLHVIPFEPSFGVKYFKNIKNSNSKFSINKNSYIFYPAQFWAHKNHTYLIDGVLSLEKDYGYKINIIFTGSDKGNLNYIKDYVRQKKISKRVDFLGFVSDEKVIEIYKNSLALVMPSYFGPTNIPPLEAFHLGVPLIYSDNYDNKKIIGDAGLAVDLNNEKSLSFELYRLITDSKLRSIIINKGYKKLEEINSINRLKVLEKLMRGFYRKKITYKF